MHLVGFFQYRELAFRRAKRAEGGFQPIKALLACPEHGEEAWCKISARSVESFHSYGQKTALSVFPYITSRSGFFPHFVFTTLWLLTPSC